MQIMDSTEEEIPKWAGSDFDLGRVVQRLISPTERFKGEKTFLYAALLAWITWPADTECIEAVLMKRVIARIGWIEERAANRAEKGEELIAIQRAQRSNENRPLFDQFLIPYGGTNAISRSISHLRLAGRTSRQWKKLALIYRLVALMHVDVVNHRPTNIAACISRFSSAYRGGKSIRTLWEDWKEFKPTAPFAYALLSTVKAPHVVPEIPPFRTTDPESKGETIAHILTQWPGRRLVSKCPRPVSVRYNHHNLMEILGRARFAARVILASVQGSQNDWGPILNLDVNEVQIDTPTRIGV
jgi:hypothetical protein